MTHAEDAPGIQRFSTQELNDALGTVSLPSLLIRYWGTDRQGILDELHRRALELNPQVTARSFKLFMDYVRDSGNWSGTPLVDGNVGGGKQGRGNLTQLKRAGLITTFRSNGDTWIEFTEAGIALAAQHGEIIFL